jgi:hypothetical protein
MWCWVGALVLSLAQFEYVSRQKLGENRRIRDQSLVTPKPVPSGTGIRLWCIVALLAALELWKDEAERQGACLASNSGSTELEFRR